MEDLRTPASPSIGMGLRRSSPILLQLADEFAGREALPFAASSRPDAAVKIPLAKTTQGGTAIVRVKVDAHHPKLLFVKLADAKIR